MFSTVVCLFISLFICLYIYIPVLEMLFPSRLNGTNPKLVPSLAQGPEVIKNFMLKSVEHGFFLLKNVKCQQLLAFHHL